MRWARTSAKEGSLLFVIRVRSSAWFSSIVCGAGEVGEDGEDEGDGEWEGERVTTPRNLGMDDGWQSIPINDRQHPEV